MTPSDQQKSREAKGHQVGNRGSGPAPTTDELLARVSLSRPEDKRIFPIAFCVALVLHTLCFLIDFPESRIVQDPPKTNKVLVVRKYIPPPPQPKRSRSTAKKQKSTRKIPIPDPTPDYPEPIAEPEPDLAVESLPFEGEFLIGAPEPPPGSEYGYGTTGGTGTGPLLAGVGNVTNPVRIDGTCVRPDYPELARAARVTGEVILQAVILCDGSVAEAKVLRCTTPGFGFEGSAVAAVERWRYLPATQGGTPVAVYFTVIVDFDLV